MVSQYFRKLTRKWPLVTRRSRAKIEAISFQRLCGWNTANKKLGEALLAKKAAEAAMATLRGDHVQAARGRFADLSEMGVIEYTEARREEIDCRVEITLEIKLAGTVEQFDRIMELGGVDFRGTEWKLTSWDRNVHTFGEDLMAYERIPRGARIGLIEQSLSLVALAPSRWDGKSDYPAPKRL